MVTNGSKCWKQMDMWYYFYLHILKNWWLFSKINIRSKSFIFSKRLIIPNRWKSGTMQFCKGTRKPKF